MTNLISSACQTLNSEASSTALHKAAAATLLACIEQGLEVPQSVPKLLWKYVTTYERGGLRYLSSLGQLLGAELVAEIVEALLCADSGESHREEATFLVCAPGAAKHVTDHQIMGLVETAIGGEQVEQVSRIIARRHEVKAFDAEFLLAIRDRWMAHEDGGVRKYAVAIDREIPGMDRKFLGLMMADESSEVRIAVTEALEDVRNGEDSEAAVAIIRAAIAKEKHPDVLGHLNWNLCIKEAEQQGKD